MALTSAQDLLSFAHPFQLLTLRPWGNYEDFVQMSYLVPNWNLNLEELLQGWHSVNQTTINPTYSVKPTVDTTIRNQATETTTGAHSKGKAHHVHDALQRLQKSVTKEWMANHQYGLGAKKNSRTLVKSQNNVHFVM